MRIFLHEISDEDTDLHFTSQNAWVYDAVRSVDEQDEDRNSVLSPVLKAAIGKPSPAGKDGLLLSPPDRKVDADFNLRKVDDVVIVKGNVEAQIKLLCSRCATPYFAGVHPRFELLFTKDPELAGVARTRADGFHREHGHARHAHNEDESNLDISHLTVDYIDLSEVLTEQVQLTVPFQPLCQSGCKGICANCGADLNKGRCACSKFKDTKLFAALKDIKPKS